MKLRNITMTIITLIIMSIILIFINQQKNNSFEKLESEEVENEDYTINSKDTGSDTLLIAIHGGGLEPGTTELVEYIAKENNYSYYTFNGIKKSGNRKMHITSTDYDEPLALELVNKSLITLSFHGYDEPNKKHTYVGGLDTALVKKVIEQLNEANFSASIAPESLDGSEKDNIVNQNNKNKGVQLELSTAQREEFFKNNDLSRENRKNKQAAFYDYIEAIEKVLEK